MNLCFDLPIFSLSRLNSDPGVTYQVQYWYIPRSLTRVTNRYLLALGTTQISSLRGWMCRVWFGLVDQNASTIRSSTVYDYLLAHIRRIVYYVFFTVVNTGRSPKLYLILLSCPSISSLPLSTQPMYFLSARLGCCSIPSLTTCS